MELVIHIEPDIDTRDRVKNGNTSILRAVDGLTSLTRFGMIDDPLAPEKCIGNALVTSGAKASKPYLPPMEVHMLLSAAGGSLPAGAASTALKTVFSPPPPSWTFGDKGKKRTRRINFNQVALLC